MKEKQYNKILSRRQQILEKLLDPDNWQPNLTIISKLTGIPVSTIYDDMTKMHTVVFIKPMIGKW